MALQVRARNPPHRGKAAPIGGARVVVDVGVPEGVYGMDGEVGDTEENVTPRDL